MFRHLRRSALLVVMIVLAPLPAQAAAPMRVGGRFMSRPSTFSMARTMPNFSSFALQHVAGSTSLRQVPASIVQTNSQFPMLATVRPFPTVQATTLRTLPGGGSVVSLSGSGFRGGTVHLGTTAIQGLSAQQAFAPGGLSGLTGHTSAFVPGFGFQNSGLRSPWHNPYCSVMSGSPYGPMGGMSGSMGGMYGSMGGMYGGSYGGGGGGGAPPAAAPVSSGGVADAVAAQALLNEMNANAAYDSLGLANGAGQLSWPLGLRVLPPEAGPVRRQIDTLLSRAANARAGGLVDEPAIRDLNQAIGRMRQLLAAKDGVLPSNTYNEARGFLHQLDDTVKGLQ